MTLIGRGGDHRHKNRFAGVQRHLLKGVLHLEAWCLHHDGSRRTFEFTRYAQEMCLPVLANRAGFDLIANLQSYGTFAECVQDTSRAVWLHDN